MTSDIPSRFLDRRTPPKIVTLIALTSVSALSMNVFLPSMPGMAIYFDADYRLVQLSVALFLLVSAGLQILIGPISDKMGRRPILLSGISLFLLATLGCALSTSVEVFLAFRMCQAVIAVAMVLSRAAVRDMFPADQAASMLGYVTMGMAVVPMIGPALGGVLDTAFGWQSNFWLLLALGAMALVMTWADFGETAHKSGMTLIAQFREYPELLTSPRFWGYSLASGMSSGAFFAFLGGAPFVGTVVYGMDAATMGLYFGAPAIGYFAGNFLSGRYSVRFGVNRMILFGSITCGAGVLLSMLMISAGAQSPMAFFGFITFVGLGNGMTIPNATAGMLSVRPHLAGTASGLGGAIMLTGGAALSALAGALLTPETGAYPLLWMMLLTSVMALIAILIVIRRERQLGL